MSTKVTVMLNILDMYCFQLDRVYFFTSHAGLQIFGVHIRTSGLQNFKQIKKKNKKKTRALGIPSDLLSSWMEFVS